MVLFFSLLAVSFLTNIFDSSDPNGLSHVSPHFLWSSPPLLLSCSDPVAAS